MKLKDILPYLFYLDKAKVLQSDAYTDKNHEPEEIFCGDVFDIPWWVADMYLHNTPDAEAISICAEGNKKYFLITVVEEKITDEQKT